MRFSLSFTCLAVVIIAVFSANPEEISYNNNNHYHQQDHILDPLNVVADRETLAYFLPRLETKYRPNEEWNDVTDPRFYVLSQMDNEAFDDQVSCSFICSVLVVNVTNKTNFMF